MMRPISWGAVILWLSLFACKQAVDVSPPTVEILAMQPMAQSDTICGVLSDRVFHLIGGDTLSLELMLRDDEALSQYKIEIHQNFDCHGHAGKVEDWSFLEIVELSGTQARVSRRIPVPVDVSAGQYNYHYQIVDQAGNTTAYTEYYDLLVANPVDDEPPQLRVDDPPVRLTRESELRITGEVRDNRSLSKGGQGKLILAYQQPGQSRQMTAEVWPFDRPLGSEYAFELRYAIPRTWVVGDYEFFLTAHDAVNNASHTYRFTLAVER
jgi:hypothetical protein